MKEAGHVEHLYCCGCVVVRGNLQVDHDSDNAFLGLMREKRSKRSMLGRTAETIISEQIYRVLFGKGGYHWKEDSKQLKPFMIEIYRTSLSSVINTNSDAHVPSNAFRV